MSHIFVMNTGLVRGTKTRRKEREKGKYKQKQ